MIFHSASKELCSTLTLLSRHISTSHVWIVKGIGRNHEVTTYVLHNLCTAAVYIYNHVDKGCQILGLVECEGGSMHPCLA